MTTTGADVTNYADLTPLASYAVTTPGDYVVFASLTVTNTGANDEYLNCGFQINGTMNGAAGVSATAGATTSGSSVTAFNTPTAGTVEFVCSGSGGTTYDISNIEMRIHFLG